MEIIKKEIELKQEILDLIPEKTFFFDIETLGLSPATAPVYLIGTLDLLSKKPLITLFFANDTGDEEALLKSFSEYTKSFDTLITFNGEAFDIPFVKKRDDKYGICDGFNRIKSIDIFKELRPLKKPLGLSRMGQKSLEEFLGIFREDKYDGGKLISVYKEYEQSKDPYLKELLILHNFEDVMGMPNLLKILAYKDLQRGFFKITEIDTKDENRILFKAELNNCLPKGIRVLLDNFHVKAEDYMIVGALDTVCLELKCFHKNLKDYVYLPGEDMIVPKKLAGTIPAGRKEKPRRENCCTKVKGTFFFLPSEKKFKSYFNLSDKLLFQKDYKSDDCHILIDINKNSPEDSELSELIKSMIRYAFS